MGLSLNAPEVAAEDTHKSKVRAGEQAFEKKIK